MLNRRIVITVILAAITIGIFLQLMLMRIEAVGFYWIVAILGLAAVAILVMAGFMYFLERGFIRFLSC